MLLLLLVLLVSLLIVAYFIMNQDILSPWIISIYMFLLTVIVATLNYNNWNEDISFITVLCVMLGLIFFGIGEIFSCSVYLHFVTKHEICSYKYLDSNKFIKIKSRYIFFTILLICTVIYFHYQHVLNLANQVGFSKNLPNLLYYVRRAQFSSEIDSSRPGLLNLGLTFSTVISYFFVFIFLFNLLISEKNKVNLIYILPCLLNIINIVLTTGRTQFINLATYVLIVFFFMLKQKYRWTTQLNNKILKYGVIGIILFFVAFRLSGYLTGKSENISFGDNFSIYIGSPIIALSKYLSNPTKKFMFGSETFYSMYHVLRKLGFNIPHYNLTLPFLSWNNVNNVNIYTAIRRYIHDFGILGMSFIMCFLGLFYGLFYNYVKQKKYVSLGTLVYAMYFFPISQLALEERFFTNIISIQGVYNLIFMTLIWKFFIRKRNMI